MSVNAAYANLNGSMVIINGRPPLKEIIATTDAYPKGWHEGNPGGLDAIDTDLATANIKNGITIFGKVGSADVHDISDATAIAAEVIEDETFYAVSGGIRTGTMPIVALAEGANEYPAGYHAGADSLTAVDGELVTGSIKFGVTIFGVAGHTNVRDSSDANLTAAEAPTGKTFYAGGGAKKTGTGTKTLNPANENVLAGYYAATTLSAVDEHLATANIKSGINIFGFAGKAEVVDTTTASPIAAARMRTDDEGWANGVKYTGTGTKTLSPDNDTVAAGYYAATLLRTVDAHLDSANIKAGVTIFGFAGNANVVDTSSGDAVAGDIRTGKKAWVDGAEVTGDIPEVAIAAGSENVPAGIHTATTLSTIDTDLATANIKSGKTIFGFAGKAEVVDTTTGVGAIAGDIKDGKVGFVNGSQITGTMPTVALDPALNQYLAGYHAGAASLTAVDEHLAAGNIKDGVEIFGVTGTLVAGTLAEDVEGDAYSADFVDTEGSYYAIERDINPETELSLISKALTFDASSLAFAAAFIHCVCEANTISFRLYMGGLQMVETPWRALTHSLNYILRDFKALSDEQTCELKAYNSAAAARYIKYIGRSASSEEAVGIAVGSVKLV